jgi:twinkle protein
MCGKCHSCGRGYPSIHPVYGWAEEEYPTKRSTTTTIINDDNQRRQPMTQPVVVQEFLTPVYRSNRDIWQATMEFYGVQTFVNSDGESIKEVYKYPSGGTKTRILPKSFRVDNFKSDELFGMQMFNAGSAKAVTITEGELDAMSAYQMLGSKYPVVSLPSATPSGKLFEKCKDWLSSFEKIYLSFDSDGKAEGVAQKLANIFPNKVYRVPHDKFKDANEFLMAGEQAAYKNAWYNAQKYSAENIYLSEDKFLGLLHNTPDHAYIPTGINALDDKILGIMRGHFTVIKAPTGIGKSEFMRYLEYNFIKNHPQVKFACWHLEETKLRSLLGVVSYYLEDNLTRKDLIESKNRMADVEAAIKHIANNSGYMQFHMKEEDTADDFVDQIRILAEVYECSYVFVEPLQDIVTVSDDKSKEAVLADLSIRLSKLSADLNVGIVTIAHTNENGDPKYCKMIGQRASVVIDLSRDKDADDEEARNTTSLYVKKNRPCGLEGWAGDLIFDHDSFTLRESGGSW